MSEENFISITNILEEFDEKLNANKNQFNILINILTMIGDKLQSLEKEHDDYSIHNMIDWVRNYEIEDGAIVKHRFKDYGEGYVININVYSTYPLEVHFSNYPEYIECSFNDVEIIK